MERDCRFAERIKSDAQGLGFNTIVVDGINSIEGNYQSVQNYFELK